MNARANRRNLYRKRKQSLEMLNACLLSRIGNEPTKKRLGSARSAHIVRSTLRSTQRVRYMQKFVAPEPARCQSCCSANVG